MALSGLPGIRERNRHLLTAVSRFFHGVLQPQVFGGKVKFLNQAGEAGEFHDAVISCQQCVLFDYHRSSVELDSLVFVILADLGHEDIYDREAEFEVVVAEDIADEDGGVEEELGVFFLRDFPYCCCF